MATMDELKIWLEVAQNLLPKAGFAVVIFALAYIARHTWKSREDWRLGLPWSAYTKYLKKIHTEFGYVQRLNFSNHTTLRILASRPEASKRFNSDDVYDLEGVLSLAVLERKLVVLTGAQTSGKTELLHTLAVRASSPETHRKLGFSKLMIPFYISAKFVNPSLTFAKAIEEALRESKFRLQTFQINRALRRGRALLLFDGLEEIADRQTRQRFLMWLDTAQKLEKSAVQVVLACRPETLLLSGVELKSPHFAVSIRNFALQKIRALRAVTESHMPAILRSPWEAGTEYLMIAPPPHHTLLRGANKMAPPYYYHLAKFPVTRHLYDAFVKANNHRVPAFGDDQEIALVDLPVVGIDWEDAESYCEWLNQMSPGNITDGFVFRLPTEEEWEWAASGNVRVYPWGNAEPDATRANFGDHESRLTPVHAYPAGATPQGLMDMAGNIWEWTSTTVVDKPEMRIVRGGAAFNEASALQCVARDGHPKGCSRYIGFRIARVPRDLEIKLR